MRKAVERIVNYTVEVAKPEKIILFGSVADATNNLYSDVDLIVVTESGYLSKELELRISSFAKEHSLQADVLVRTPRQIAQAALNPLSLLDSAVKHGQILYEKV